MARMVGFKGVEQNSPTLSSAMSNLTPAFTFTLAVIFRFHLVVSYYNYHYWVCNSELVLLPCVACKGWNK